jgi:endonuclease III
MLQELIMTDPILSKQPPQKVVNAYQQFIRLAPQLSKEKEVVGSSLREMLMGQGLHTSDANQLVETNTNVMRQDQMLHGMTAEGKPEDRK